MKNFYNKTFKDISYDIYHNDEVESVMVDLVLMIGWGVFCSVGLSGALSPRRSLALCRNHSKTKITITPKIIKNAKITLDNNKDMEKGPRLERTHHCHS